MLSKVSGIECYFFLRKWFPLNWEQQFLLLLYFLLMSLVLVHPLLWILCNSLVLFPFMTLYSLKCGRIVQTEWVYNIDFCSDGQWHKSLPTASISLNKAKHILYDMTQYFDICKSHKKRHHNIPIMTHSFSIH
jgi:hypothetical protein